MPLRLGDKHCHKRLPTWEPFDEIRLKVVERWKTSGLSGDEWCFSVAFDFYFKGVLVQEGGGYHDVETALVFLPVARIKACEPISEKVILLDDKMCDQPSCRSLPDKWFWLKELFSRQGDRLDPSDQSYRYYRKFCSRHASRGDSSREDCDANYVEMTDAERRQVTGEGS